MNAPRKPTPEIRYSACPHDCPSTCALEVEKLDDFTIGRVRGAGDNSYTAGVICAKVGRYAERIHHPERLLHPLQRVGGRGGEFRRIGWDDALDIVAERFLEAERRYGAETVWPYFYAGTMGLVQRDGIHRLRHAKKYSGQHSTICVALSWTGWIAGHGRLAGADPREMAKSDVVVIWGTNPVNTQVNVMTHAIRARKERGAKIVAVDVYRNGTAEQADMFVCVKPGTDAAFACGVMHVLFRDGHADWPYLEKYSDRPRDLEAHLRTRTPEWASAISGVPVAEIEAFAKLVGENKRTFFRLGYGFSRGRSGAMSMHAAGCIPVVTGAWQYEGGGAFHNNGAIYRWDRSFNEGTDKLDPKVRLLDQSRIGEVLTGSPEALKGGPPVTALLVQNTNPMSVAPDQNVVHRGFAREDLFVCVHEQFMTETARVADIVLPATMFLEHDDVYQGGGHQHILLGPKIVEPPGECRSNHDVICALARRVGAEHPGFEVTALDLVNDLLTRSGWPDAETLRRERWIDCQPPFEEAHYLKGFANPDGKFHFSPNWARFRPHGFGPEGAGGAIPELPDHWEVIEAATEATPFRLVTAPSRSFLNSSFNETPGSRKREKRPQVKIRPDDAERLAIADGAKVRVGNARGSILIHAEHFEGLNPGVVVIECIWPNDAFEEGKGVNVLVGADPAAPTGGACFHDNAVWIRPA